MNNNSALIANNQLSTARFHLPGLFEFYEFYKVFLPLFYEKREYFYPWCDIGSIYGSPADCLWGGGRIELSYNSPIEVAALMREYGISSRLTFSNSHISEKHLSDTKCNYLCKLFENNGKAENGIIIYSDLLLSHIRTNYPGLYFVSSTTKVLTSAEDLSIELNREEFRYVVPDFRFNNQFEFLSKLTAVQKKKAEFLCNECCDYGCSQRKACYENVSRKIMGQNVKDHICASRYAAEGYVFSKAMKNPAFIGHRDITNIYLPMGFSEFKIEGRSLGSMMLLEFILYYMTKPEYQLQVREKIYLNHSLDIF